MRPTSPVAAAVVAAACAVPAAAEQVAASNFAKLRQTPTYQGAVVAGAYRSGAWIADPCKGGKAALGDRLGVLAAPVVVNERLQPQSGSWVEHVAIQGCTTPRQLNVLVTVRGPGSLATVPMLPGTTPADPVLQKDGAAFAFAAAAIDPKGCKPIFMADTRYVGPVADGPTVPGKPA